MYLLLIKKKWKKVAGYEENENSKQTLLKTLNGETIYEV